MIREEDVPGTAGAGRFNCGCPYSDSSDQV